MQPNRRADITSRAARFGKVSSESGGLKTPHNISFFAYAFIKYNGKNLTHPMLSIDSMSRTLVLGMNFWNHFGVRATVCGITVTADTSPTVRVMLTEAQKKKLSAVMQRIPTSAKNGRLG